MSSRHFNYFWEKAIAPAIQSAKNEIDDTFKDNASLKFSEQNEYYSNLKNKGKSIFQI